MYCPKCGKKAIPDDALYCVYCGVRLPRTSGTGQAPSPTPAPAPATEDPEALLLEGEAHAAGKGRPQDAEAAHRCFLRAAELGLTAAQVRVARAYLDGAGVAADPARAFEWYTKAARDGRGDPEALYRLGTLYADGRGVARDDAAARRNFVAAAEQGSPEAQYSAAVLSLGGRGGPRDVEAALRWFERAAEQGHAASLYNLGVMHRDGVGVPQDVARARTWFERAAEKGDAGARHNLGVMALTGVDGSADPRKAAEWFLQAAESGHPGAQYNLGALYAAGSGVPRDLKAARHWLGKAAEQGMLQARRHLELLQDAVRCPHCGADPVPAGKFCMRCGGKLSAPAVPPPAVPARPACLEALARLHVVDRKTSSWLHDPVYDCGSDLLHRPCSWPGFAEGRGDRGPTGNGYYAGLQDISGAVGDFGRHPLDVVVAADDHVVLLWNSQARAGLSRSNPGARAMRFVRTGESEWFAWCWDTGARASAADLDPPFTIEELAGKPETWLEREREVASRGESNPAWREEAAGCPHRKASQADPDTIRILEEGPFLVTGPGRKRAFATLTKEGSGRVLEIPSSEGLARFPDVLMPTCRAFFSHSIPGIGPGPVSQEKGERWMRRFAETAGFDDWDDVQCAFLGCPENSVELILTWGAPVRVSEVAKILSEVEKGYRASGGALSS